MKLWVVEIKIDGKWLATVVVATTREHGRRRMMEWRRSFPQDEIRLAKYVREK